MFRETGAIQPWRQRYLLVEGVDGVFIDIITGHDSQFTKPTQLQPENKGLYKQMVIK